MAEMPFGIWPTLTGIWQMVIWQLFVAELPFGYLDSNSNANGTWGISKTRKAKKSPHLLVITARQRSCKKVIFSVVPVRHSVHKGSPHVTITHHALDLSVQLPLPYMAPRPWPAAAFLVASGGLHSRPVQTFHWTLLYTASSVATEGCTVYGSYLNSGVVTFQAWTRTTTIK